MNLKSLYSIVFADLQIDLSEAEMAENYDRLTASATLPELEESVLNARFVNNKESADIAGELELTIEQVSQLESKALKRLQYYARKEILWPEFRNAKRLESAD